MKLGARVLYVFVVCFIYACNAGNTANIHTDSAAANKIVLGTIDSLHSKALGEDRTIWIYTPNSFTFSQFTAQKQYPVVYLLDGEAHFLSFCGMLEHLSEENSSHSCPDMIVVGIINKHRILDLTHEKDTTNTEPNGGGEHFDSFLQKELIPYVDEHYHPAPFRMLIGHSLAGLFALQTLATSPTLFNAIIAIDPSMGWNEGRTKANIERQIRLNQYTKTALFIGVANTMNTEIPIKHIIKDTSKENLHMQLNLIFIEELRKMTGINLRWDYNYYENEDHQSVTIRAMYDGLHFIFRTYPFHAAGRLLDKDTPADSAVKILQNHYSEVSEALKYKALPPEKLVYSLANQSHQKGQFEKAEALLLLNTHSYPTGVSAYRALAGFYNKIGQKTLAGTNLHIADSLATANN